MKNVFAAAAVFLGMTTASFAQDVGFVGYGEYAFEAEAFETGVGMEFGFYDRLVVTPMLTATRTEADGFEFQSVDVTADYTLNETVDLYATLATNSDLEYQDFTVGASFNF